MSIKTDFNTILKSVSDSVNVFQARPEKETQLPCFVYSVSDQVPVYDHVSEVYREIELTVDILTKTSKESSSLLESLASVMYNNGYVMISSNDIGDPSGLSHVVAIFNFLRT